jgi:hypothetical protein
VADRLAAFPAAVHAVLGSSVGIGLLVAPAGSAANVAIHRRVSPSCGQHPSLDADNLL